MKADAKPAISAAGQNVIKLPFANVLNVKKPRESRAFYKNKNSIRLPRSHSPFAPEFGSAF